MSKWFTPISLIPLSMLLTACSGYNGTWPSLSDPIPDASERERVSESSRPAEKPIEQEPQSPLTKSVAIKQLTATRAALEQAAVSYSAAYNSILSSTDSEEKAAAWREAQLMLTRYSTVLSRLDSIRDASGLDGEKVQENAKALYGETEALIAAERQKLMNLQP